MTHTSVSAIDNISDLCGIIRDRRKALSITQGELSEFSGIDQSNISRIEAGVAGATLDTFLRLCQPLGIDLLAGLRQ